jgi:uncharacterized membrane protein YccC
VTGAAQAGAATGLTAWFVKYNIALIFAAVAIGLPEAAPFWQPVLLYLVGAAFYALVLGAEAVLDRRRPERQMLAGLILALSGLARARAASPGVPLQASPAREAARRAVTDRSRALYAALLETRRAGRTHETATHADILDAADAVFAALIGDDDPRSLSAAADWLEMLAGAVRHRRPVPPPPEGQVGDSLTRLAATVERGAFVTRNAAAGVPVPARGWSVLHLSVGPAVVEAALKLALCIGIAFAMRYVVHRDHWYWVPLTVALVMKPDLGSVFARAVLRAAGTTLGVGIGVAMLVLLPKGYVMVLGMGVLALLLPWAKAVSYAAVAVVLTPMVLILIDLIAPGTQTVNDGGQRLADTVLGAAIVLVFGYFLWPRSQALRLAADFGAALQAVANYLTAAAGPDGSTAMPAADASRAAYARLSDLRAALGRSMAEPPPAGREAAAWFPLVAGAERLCDRITAHAAQASGGGRPAPDQVAAVAARIRAIGASGQAKAAAVPVTDPFLRDLAGEAERIAARLHDVSSRLASGAVSATGSVPR